MTQATAFETTVYVAEYQAKRALAAGRRKDTRDFDRHRHVMTQLIDGSEYPDLAVQELVTRLGPSRSAVLQIYDPIVNLYL